MGAIGDKSISDLPLVSIVIPSYNAEKYLKEAIDSVLNQTYPNIELIVLDDGSTDQTKEVLESYAKGSFYWESHPNMGQSSTLNKGWHMAKGDILSYLSADDFLLQDAVAISVEKLLTHESVMMTYCDYILMDDLSEDIQEVCAPEFNYEKMVSEIEVQPGPGVFFRKVGFEKVGGWDSSYHQVPDLEYWLRLGLLGDFLRIPEQLAKFRVHPDSQSFAPPSIEKSEEILAVMANYFSSPDLPPNIKSLKNKSLALAHVFAARFHLRAGRLYHTITHLWLAFKTSGTVLLSKRACRLIGNALVYRLRYLLKRLTKD